MSWTLPGTSRLNHATARSLGYLWSPTEIVRRLQRLDPASNLRPRPISDWRDDSIRDRLRRKKSVLRNILTPDFT